MRNLEPSKKAECLHLARPVHWSRKTQIGANQLRKRNQIIRTFEFKLVLDQVDVDEAEADALYARCKDGTLITVGGVAYMEFDRQSRSLDDSIRSAIADVNAAGFRIARVEIEADSLAPQ